MKTHIIKKKTDYNLNLPITLKNISIQLSLLIIMSTLVSCSTYECGGTAPSDEKYLSIEQVAQQTDNGLFTYLLKAYKMVDVYDQTGAYSCESSEEPTEESVAEHPMNVYYCATDDVGPEILRPMIEHFGTFESTSEQTIEIEKAELVTFIFTPVGKDESTENKTFFRGKDRYIYDEFGESEFSNLEHRQWINWCYKQHKIKRTSRPISSL